MQNFSFSKRGLGLFLGALMTCLLMATVSAAEQQPSGHHDMRGGGKPPVTKPK